MHKEHRFITEEEAKEKQDELFCSLGYRPSIFMIQNRKTHEIMYAMVEPVQDNLGNMS